ncbi:MAG TPA: PAS domain S-box protein [Flavisolibacter sp.]|nr:PAS domain S-box protein [Flavisolibacter sp.]
MEVIRNAGISIMEKIAWGMHFYLFYESKSDLQHLIAPYFKSGLESNECCIWIASGSTPYSSAVSLLKRCIPEAGQFLKHGKILVNTDEWKAADGGFDLQSMFSWLDQTLAQKLKEGASGLRICLCPAALRKLGGLSISSFEKELDLFLPYRAMIMLCYHKIQGASSEDVLDISASNLFVGAYRNGTWQIIKSPGQYKSRLSGNLPVPADKLSGKTIDTFRIHEKSNSDQDQVVQETDLTDSAINTLPGIFYLIDENRKYLKWNKNFEVITGYNAREIEHMDPLDFFPADHQHIIDEGMYMVFNREGVRDAEVDVLTKDGRRIPFYLNGKIINYEGRYCLIGVGINISDRKRAEDELAAAYLRLSNHVENTPLAVIEWDEGLFIRRWSKRAEEIFGWDAAEALRKNMNATEFAIIYEEDRPEVEHAFNQLITGVADRNVMQIRNYTNEGDIIFCEWYNSVLRDNQHNVVTILSLIHNVTERKRAEQTLNQSYEEIRLLTKNLQDIRESEQTRIAREIHDELGQQLTVLKMDVSWLNKKLEKQDDAIRQRIRDLLDILDGTVKSVRRICAELRPSLLDDLGLVAALEWHLEEFEKRSGIRTELRADEYDWPLSNDIKIGLFRIFQESLTNIARHAGATHIAIEIKIANQVLVMRIEDNGKGFDREEIRKKKTLGLVGIEERSAMIGGQCIITSKIGEGTVVEIKIPLTKNVHTK